LLPGASIAAVTPVLPFVLGLLALATGAAILRSFGPRYRVGRLLSATSAASVADAAALATAGGPARYVKITGRIDAETDFEDDAHRPLVFRRTRLEIREGSDWRAVDDQREAVPFEVHEGLDGIRIRHEDLDDGLVVLPRESVGAAADVPDRLPAGTDPTTPVRLRVQLVSSVEHAVVLGVPMLDESGAPVLAAGLGRPLILTTLEPDEAMRVLANDHRRRPLAAALAFALGFVLLTIGVGWAVVDAVL
jgi:hypothetical protein